MKKEMNSAKKQGFWTLTALFLIMSVTTFAQEAEIKAANKLLAREQTAKAIETLNKATSSYPEATKLWYYLGMAQAKTGDTKNAEISFQKGIDKDPKDGLGYAGKGYLRMLENKPAEAKQLFTQALEISKNKNPEVMRAIGEAYLLNDKFTADAIAILQKAKSSNDTEPNQHILLGDAFLKQNKGGDAVSSYERAAKLDPSNGLGLYKAGLVFFRSKNIPVAEENLIKATTVDPTFAPAYKELGELYYQNKQSAKAVAAWENYMKNIENPEKAESNYAFYLFMDKQYDKANSIFTRLLAKPEVSLTTYKYAFYAAVEAKKFEEAKTLFAKYKAKAGSDISAADWNYHGEMLQEMKQDSLAVRSFARAYAKDTSRVEILAKVGEIFFKGKKYDSAAYAYKELIPKRTKPDPKDFYNLGRAQYAIKDFAAADTTFRKLIELAPSMTVGYLWEGRTNAALDPDMKKGLAKPFFEKLIEMGLTNPEKSKADLIQGYKYLAAYAIQIEDNINKAEEYVNKILALDPNDKDALEYKKAIKEGREAMRKAQQQQQQQQQR
jgi:tetratricopeptide (TPR) repeat protein